MIHLTYANHFEALLEVLAAKLCRPFTSCADFFCPTVLLVPNTQIESYLRLGLATANGIAANLHCESLFAYLHRLMPANLDGRRLRLIDRSAVHMAIVAMMSDAAWLDRAEAQALRHYLGATEAPAQQHLRIVQLADHLSAIYEDYAIARPEIMRAWHKGRAYEPAKAHLEQWQRWLWGALHEAGAPFDPHHPAGLWLSLDEALRHPEVNGALAASLPPQIYAFAFSYVAAGHCTALATLAQHTDVHLFALNPCQEFWEDLPGRGSPVELAARISRQPTPASENPALLHWGKPGRDTSRLLNAIAAYDFTEAYVDPLTHRDTILARVQHDILHRTYSGGEHRCCDDSIQIFAAPSRHREVEVAANHIWSLMLDPTIDPPLRFNEIAVAIPSTVRDAYLPRVHAVFHEANDLPFNIVGMRAGAYSRIFEIIQALLELPTSRLTRRDLLAVLVHPNICHAYDEADPEAWQQWCDEVGIIDGADAADHADDYIAGEHFTWEQGLYRIALAAFVQQDATLAPSPLPPLGAIHGRLDSAALFCRLARIFITDARVLRQTHLPIAGWSSLLRTWFAEHLFPISEADNWALDNVMRALRDLSDRDLPGHDFSFVAMREIVRTRLASIEAKRGHFLADGVVVSTLVPSRALPARVCFVLGLNEGDFPAPDAHQALDLRTGPRQDGESSPRERDIYAFLETLVNTKEKLILSYVARDEQSGESLPPSVLLDEMRTLLERHYRDPQDAPPLVITQPIHRHVSHSPSGTEARPSARFLPEAAIEAHLLALREHFQAHHGRPPCAIAELMPQAASSAAAICDHRYGQKTDPLHDNYSSAHLSTSRDGERPLSLRALVDFLHHPHRAYTQHFLAMPFASEKAPDTEEALEALDHEQNSAELLRDLLWEIIHLDPNLPGDKIVAAYDARTTALQQQGRFPLPPFATPQRTRDLFRLLNWCQQLRSQPDLVGVTLLRPVMGRPQRRTHLGRIGRAPTPMDVPTPVPSLRLLTATPTGERQWVGVHDILQDRFLSRGGQDLCDARGVLLLCLSEGVPLWLRVRTFVEHMALTALDLAAQRQSLVCINTATEANEAALLPVTTPAEAQAWLELLLGQLVTGQHELELPLKAVFAAYSAACKKGVDHDVALRHAVTKAAEPTTKHRNRSRRLLFEAHYQSTLEQVPSRLGPLLRWLVASAPRAER